jgi:exodeoxyribonuclease V alpha subunit
MTMPTQSQHIGKQEQQEAATIAATLDRIIFQKDETGFIIGQFFDTESSTRMTAVGNIINPQLTMEYKLTGAWEENKRFGKQFKFFRATMVVPADTNGIYKYIVRVCKFVGATVGHAIVSAYGKKTLDIMKNNPARLAADINGITMERALEIQETLVANEYSEAVMVELGGILDVPGIRKSLLGDLIHTYKSQAAEMVKQNPYILTRFRGVGFILADRVAIHIGFARDSIYRKEAAARHVIEEAMQHEGHVWVAIDDLITKMKELIQITNLMEGVQSLIDAGSLVATTPMDSNVKHVAFKGPASDEAYIGQKLMSAFFVSAAGDALMGLEVA